jgi:ubiquinone/menaquinone biosynthesis C-methylase UbiE
MKREPLSHERVFSDEVYAEDYARGHWRMAEKFGLEYTKKLNTQGFEGGRILDVGCGFGATNLVLAKEFVSSEITGIDLSEPLLEVARAKANESNFGSRVRFEKADVHEIPFEDNSFEVVLNVNMVHLVEHPIQMLNEIERVLIPQGFLYIADLRRSWLGLLEVEIKSGLSVAEAKKLFASSDLRLGRFSWGLLWWKYEGKR